MLLKTVARFLMILGKKLIMGHQKASLIFLTLFTKKKTFNFPNKAKNPKNTNITSSGKS